MFLRKSLAASLVAKKLACARLEPSSIDGNRRKRLHFGLGINEKMTEVDIRWPNGETEVLRDVAADFIYTIVEGTGIQQKAPLPALPRP